MRRPYRTFNRGVKEPAFCPNPFGCVAGAEPWERRREFYQHRGGGHAHCSACHTLSNYKYPALMHYSELYDRVQHCPVCHWLFGTVNSSGLKRYILFPEFDEWAKGWMLNYAGLPIKPVSCPVCGFEATRVFNILKAVGYGAHGDTEKNGSVSKKSNLDRDVLAVMFDVLRLMKGNVRKEVAAGYIRREIIGHDLSLVRYDAIFDLLKQITGENSRSSSVLMSKLDDMFLELRHYQMKTSWQCSSKGYR